jgi:transcriptional regulator with XRE-family HTH domain
MNQSVIKKLLVEKKMTMEALAEKIGMSRVGLYTALKNNTLSVGKLELIAGALNEPIEIFLYDNISDTNDFIAIHERRLAKLRQIELQLKTGSDEEIIQQFNLKDEEIKQIKRKLYVIESIIFDIKNFQEKYYKEYDPEMLARLNNNSSYMKSREQLIKAIEAILNIDRDESKLDEYREFIYALASE